MTKEGPKLIECAGRVPGDDILTLIEHAYDFNVYENYIKMLCNMSTAIKTYAICGTAIKFFMPNAGILEDIRNLDILDKYKNEIIDFNITVNKGDTIPLLTSSWSRTAGYIIVKNKTNYQVKEFSDYLTNNIKFLVR
ncbi:hypothetical protein MHB44_16765 [Lysinibacillus sp. FSL H8-0500]|uniref:hypothetical protein n=1 Tax=Lysinibacillus sp. FSL H8-0500 TaxID=2921393 RepID=UPI003100AF79